MHPRNIRTTLTDLDELAASIRAEGVLQPLLAHARFERRPGVADLEVIDGHRRLAAADIAGLRRVPVIVRPRVTDERAVRDARRRAEGRRRGPGQGQGGDRAE